MARYDDDTKKFMSEVSGQEPPKKPEFDDVARKGLATVKGLMTAKNPLSVAARLGTAAAVSKAFDSEKLAAMSPLSVYSYLNEKYGREWHDWEPETVWQTLLDDDGIDADRETKDMVMAFQVLVNTNAAHEHWHIFENVCHAFSRNPVDFGSLQPAELDEVALAFKIINAVRPQQKFEDEVCGYVAACAKNAGVVFLPKDLFEPGCQGDLDELNNDLELRARVAERWPNPPESGDPMDLKIQLLRLKEIEGYARA